MKKMPSNLIWLFLILMFGAAALGFFYLPLFFKIFNFALLFGAVLIVLLTSKTSAGSDAETEPYWLKSVIMNLREGIIAYDQNFKILIFNPAAEQIFGLKAKEIIGQSFTLKVKEGSVSRFQTLLTVLFPALAQTIVRRSEPGSYPQVADISFDDPALELRVTTQRILNENGRLLGYLKLIHDRTRELELLRSKSEFITIASHQLRTPLSGLKWAIENLKNEPLPQEQKALVVNASGAINKLMKISEDLLDVAKIEEGRFGYSFQEIDAIKFLEAALIQAEPVANQYRVKLYFDKPREETVKITVDPQKFAMVISNLLDNAIKYNIPNGEVIIKLERLGKNPYIQVSVKDTGIGISSEDLKKMFTKFFRSENAVKVSVEGTGLGLYIVKNIIRRHGGKIWVESTLNRGATFYFTLPTNPTLIPAKEIIYDE